MKDSFDANAREKVRDIFHQAQAVITDDHFVYAKKPDGWYHGSDYVNKDAIYLYPDRVAFLCSLIAEKFFDRGIEVVVGPTVGAVRLSHCTANSINAIRFECRPLNDKKILDVCADEEDVIAERAISMDEIRRRKDDSGEFNFTAFGNITVVMDSGHPLALSLLSKIRYFEKVGTRRVVRRGYDKIVKGKRCLIVEDIINSGATVQKTAEAVRRVGGTVVGVGALCNRSGGKVTAETLGVPELLSLLDVEMKMYKEEECPICKEKGPKSVRTDLGKGREFLVRNGLLKE